MYFLTSRDTLSRSTLLLDSLICRREQNAFRWISRGFRSFNFLWISHRSLKLILNFNVAFIKETYTFASQARDLRELYGSFSTSAAKYRLFPSVRSGWVDIGKVRESIGKASGNAERARSLEQPITARDSVCLAHSGESLQAGWKEIQIPSRKQNILVFEVFLRLRS